MFDFASLRDLPPMAIGTIYAKPGSPHIFRVIGEDNLVQRFTGNRKERAHTLALWREVEKGRRQVAGLMGGAPGGTA